MNFSDILKDQRECGPVKISQESLSYRLGLGQGTVSRLERNAEVELQNRTARFNLEFLQAYGFSEAKMLELARRFSFELPYEFVAPRLRRSVAEGSVTVRYAGIVSAGTSGGSMMDEGEVICPSPILERYGDELDKIFVCQVAGLSMTSDDVKRDIPEGSLVYFHSGLSPEPGEVICCWIREASMNVVKRFQPEPHKTLLTSNNLEHNPIIITEPDECVLQGVYLMHQVSGSRL